MRLGVFVDCFVVVTEGFAAVVAVVVAVVVAAVVAAVVVAVVVAAVVAVVVAAGFAGVVFLRSNDRQQLQQQQ